MNLNRLAAFWPALLCATTLSAQQLPDLYHSESYGDPPFLIEEGWTPLLNGTDLTGWAGRDGAAHEWFTAQAVWWQRIFNPARLTAKVGPGGRIVNGPNGRTADFVTTGRFGDMELYLEFMTARSSNSGVYIHGLYEVQIFDSYGFQGPLMVGDCAGIYEGEGSHGSPPLVNACLAPGAWQSLHIWFKAPRFDTSGKKTSNARILRVLLNGMLVQREFELPGPTLGHLSIPEAAQNPLMLQGDHGAIAFRSIYVRPLSETAH
jgi:hypothetical protein